jgi:uncharacterized membrane protein YgdD (TMEM256/DUF423 family)
MNKTISAPINWIRISALFGFLAVALGAFGAHGLKPYLSASLFQTYQTAVLYQFVHTLALMGYGILSHSRALPKWPAVCFIAGILLFSGSLYGVVLTGMTWMGAITPIGGVLFLAGWVGVGLEVK